MANEYGEIEQLVNDVTSLDTARMTLRWALERLNSIEKEKADLKKNLTIAEETAKKLQVKEASLTDAYTSRSKTLEEKEDFYTKLEATMSLLGEGKLDIQQLLKKEAKLDSLRHSLECEYSDKFEELDRNQRSVIERWNSRLLEVESQYAGRLAEAQKKYDGLRSELEGEYQGRMTALQTSFKSREKSLSERIGGLEGSVRQSEEKVEVRRRELEGEYLAKKREAEENYRKLRNMLEAGLEEKIRAMDSDHAEQVRSFEASWQTERARLLEEQRVREDQFSAAQARIKEIENTLAAQQEAHHSELLKIISEKENAFRAQLLELEAEKSAKEATVRDLQARLEKKADVWEADRSRLQAEFDGRVGTMEAGLREHAASLDKEYAAKKQEVESVIAASREDFRKEFDARLRAERQSMEAEKARLEGEKREREEALALNAAKLKELEGALAATREEHHRDLMERLSSGEASFREKLAGFESEKHAYNETINNLTDEMRLRDAAILEEKKKIAAEFDAKADIYEVRLANTEKVFEEKRLAYEEKLAALSARLEEASKASALEKENFRNGIARISAETGALAEERIAGIRADYEARKDDLAADVEFLKIELAGRDRQLAAEREKLVEELSKASIEAHQRSEERVAEIRADYEARKAELEKEFAARYGDRLKSLELEKARVYESLAEREGQLEASYAKAAELDGVIAGLRRASSEEKAFLYNKYSEEMKSAQEAAEEAANAREAELCSEINVLRGELTEKDRLLSLEREKLAADLSKASADANDRGEERAAAVQSEYEGLLASLEAEADTRIQELREMLAGKEALLEKYAQERAEAERILRADFERRVSETEAEISAKAAVMEADYAGRIERLETEAAARAEAVNAEAAAKMEFERRNWQAERARFERTLEETSGQFLAAQKEIGNLNTGLHTEARKNAAAEAAFNRQLMEAKAGYDKALSAAQGESENFRNALKMEAAQLRREAEERVRAVELNAKKVLEQDLALQKAGKLDFDEAVAAAVGSAVEAEKGAWLAEKERLERSAADLSQRFSSAQKDLSALSAENRALGEKLLESEGRLNSQLLSIEAAAEKAAEGRLQSAVNVRTAAMQKVLSEAEAGAAAAEHERQAAMQWAQEETTYLKETVAGLKRELGEAYARMNNLDAEFVEKRKGYQAGLIRVQQENAAEFETKMKDAVEAAVHSVKSELSAARQEVANLKNAFNEEKKNLRITEEDAEIRLKQAGQKISDLETELAKRKVEASKELIDKMTEQEEERHRFMQEIQAKYAEKEKGYAARIDEDRKRYEAHISELERMLEEKVRGVEDEKSLVMKKLSELGRLETAAAMKENQLSEERIRSEKETEEKRQELERAYNRKLADVEKLKTELAKTIIEYKRERKAE